MASEGCSTSVGRPDPLLISWQLLLLSPHASPLSGTCHPEVGKKIRLD